LGAYRKTEDASNPTLYCAAFPNGIPDEIAYGDNTHSKKLPDQINNIVFEKEPA